MYSLSLVALSLSSLVSVSCSAALSSRLPPETRGPSRENCLKKTSLGPEPNTEDRRSLVQTVFTFKFKRLWSHGVPRTRAHPVPSFLPRPQHRPACQLGRSVPAPQTRLRASGGLAQGQTIKRMQSWHRAQVFWRNFCQVLHSFCC